MQISDSDFFGYFLAQTPPTANLFGTVSGIVFGPTSAAHHGQAARINNCTIRDFRVPVLLAGQRNTAGQPSMEGGAIGMNFSVNAGSEFAITDCDIEDNDCSINCDIGRHQIVRNSMESGHVDHYIGYAGSNVARANVGNGIIQPDLLQPVDATAHVGPYKILCTSVTVPAATFSITDPTGTVLTTSFLVGPGSATFASPIYFTITPGATPFVAGDAFTINVLNLPAASVSFIGSGTGPLTPDPTFPVLAEAQLGQYLATCTQTTPSVVFSVTDPNGAGLGTATVGTPFANQIQFTITGTGYHLGDTYTGQTVTSLATFSNTAFTPSAVAFNGVPNTGSGTIGSVVLATAGTVQAGLYLAKCTATATGGGTFTVYDPEGNAVGSPVAVGTTFNNEISFKITAGTPNDFVLGDTFVVNAVGDVLIKIGRNSGAGSIYCVENTDVGRRHAQSAVLRSLRLPAGGLSRQEPVHHHRRRSHRAGTVWLGAEANGVASYMRWNDGVFDPRTNIWFDPLLQDGLWQIYGNSEENNSTPGTDVAPAGATAPSVANLETLVVENTSATAIGNFLHGYNGQELTVIANEQPPAQTSLQTGPNIVMLSGANEPLYSGVAYQFRAMTWPGSVTPVWRQTAPMFPRTLQTETSAYLTAGGGTYSPQFKYAVDNVVVALKAAGVWSTFDAFWLFAVPDATLATYNLINTMQYQVTWTGTVNQAPNVGVTSDGTTGYGSTGINRSTATHYSFQETEARSLTAWSQVALPTQSTYAIGDSSGLGVARLAPHLGSNQIRARLNDTSSLSATSTAGGLSSAVRTASPVARILYRNGAAVGADATASGGVASDVFYLMRDGAAVAPYHSLPIAMAAIGAERSAAQELALYNALVPFMAFTGVTKF